MNILLLVDNKEVRNMMAFAVESQGKAVVYRAETIQSAFEYLLDEKPLDLIVCQDDESSVKLFKYLLSVGSVMPIVLIQAAASTLSVSAAFPDLRIVGRIRSDDPMERLGEIVDQAGASIESSKDSSENEYCRISTELLLKVIPLQGDIYIRLSSIKYVKLFKKGDTFNAVDLARYLLQKKMDYLYLRRDNCPEFIAKFKTALAAIIQNQSPGGPEAFHVAVKVQESIVELARAFGFSEEIQEVVRQNVGLVMTSVKGNAKLSYLLSQLQKGADSYVARHSVVLAHLACALSSKMAWHSDSTYEKLAYAALMHDVFLEDDRLAQVETRAELEAVAFELSKEQKQKVLDHPILAAERISQFAALPADVDTILIQHHERPDGAGFPRNLAASRIAPLSALFIISHDIVRSYIREGLGPREFAAKYKELYNAGTFKRIMDVLSKDPEMN